MAMNVYELHLREPIGKKHTAYLVAESYAEAVRLFGESHPGAGIHFVAERTARHGDIVIVQGEGGKAEPAELAV